MLLLLVMVAAAAPLAMAADRNCSAGFQDLGLEDDRCYYFSSNDSSASNETWTMAFVRCQTLGGDILSVEDPLHFYPMSVLVQQSGQDAWTGLLHVGGTYSWADETTYNEELTQFVANPSASDIYGYISAEDGLFHLGDGAGVMSFICYEDVLIPTEPPATTPAPPACPSGWEQFDDMCYLFSSDSQFWTTAEHNCSSLGADLVSIHSSSLVTFLLISAGDDVFWTGLHNENTKYAWADGSDTSDIATVVEPLLDAWASGKDCVMLDQAKYPKSLVHDDCFAQHQYVCHKPALERSRLDVDDFGYWYEL